MDSAKQIAKTMGLRFSAQDDENFYIGGKSKESEKWQLLRVSINSDQNKLRKYSRYDNLNTVQYFVEPAYEVAEEVEAYGYDVIQNTLIILFSSKLVSIIDLSGNEP